MTDTRPTVFIHIGRGKTGSTSLQTFCAINHGVLKSFGIDYPLVARAEENCGHDTFAKACIDVYPSYMKPAKNIDQAMSALRAWLCASRSPAVFFSSEQFEAADPAKVRAAIDSVLRNPTYEILYMVRPQDELAESEYNQLVKLGRFTGPFQEFLRQLFDGDFYEIASRWAAVFGKNHVTCLPYHPGQDSVFQILSRLGIDTNKLPDAGTIQTNRSLSFEQLAAVRALHWLGKKANDPEIKSINDAFHHEGTPALFFDSQEARAFRAAFDGSNAKLISEFMDQRFADVGGRKFSDEERDRIRESIRSLGFF